jgi:L-alanine-DL-glutamate epimerase-like enolase superfamily enzyme
MIKTKADARDGRLNSAAFEASRHGVDSVMVMVTAWSRWNVQRDRDTKSF